MSMKYFKIKAKLAAKTDIVASSFSTAVNFLDDSRAVIRAPVVKKGLGRLAKWFDVPDSYKGSIVYLSDAVSLKPVILNLYKGLNVKFPVVPEGTTFSINAYLSGADESVVRALFGVVKEFGLRIGDYTSRGYGRLIPEAIDIELEGGDKFVDNDQSVDLRPAENVYMVKLTLRPIQGLVIPEGYKGRLSGIMLAGVLRTALKKRLNWMGWKDIEQAVDMVFGGKGQASKVLIDPMHVSEGKIERISRIKIDHFSAGLINQDADYVEVLQNATVEGRLLIQDLPAPLIGALLLTLRDLSVGLVPLGGGGAYGYGLCEGVVEVKTRNWQSNFGRGITETDEQLDKLARLAHEGLNLGVQEA